MKSRISLPVGEVVRLYESGSTLEKCAAHFGVSVTTVRNRLIEAGVKMRPRITEVRPIEDLLRMRSQGMTQTEIAAKIGVSRQAVSLRLKKWRKKS